MTDTALATPDPAPQKPRCRLTGTDGNVFAVIGTVRRALRNAGQRDRASEFVERVSAAQNDDEALRLATGIVDAG